MRVLVTRPEPDASRLGARLKAAGHEPVLEPLMSVKYLDAGAGLAAVLKGSQALALTSANGVRALTRHYEGRHLPVFAVGAATGKAATDAGFETVHVAGGDVERLAAKIVSSLDPAKGAVVHIAGSQVAGDLAGALTSQGFQVSRHILYETLAAQGLSDALVADLRDGALDGVLVYSPRTGRVLADLMDKAGLLKAASALACYCLSANVAKAVAPVPFAACHIAATPDEAALLALLQPE